MVAEYIVYGLVGVSVVSIVGLIGVRFDAWSVRQVVMVAIAVGIGVAFGQYIS
jgi:hypothetical protein